MNKEDYYRRIEDKLDKQTSLLMAIKDNVNKEVSLIKLAHQKLRYYTVSISLALSIMIAIEYPKVIAFFKKLM
jgi:hypothetical protein